MSPLFFSSYLIFTSPCLLCVSTSPKSALESIHDTTLHFFSLSTHTPMGHSSSTSGVLAKPLFLSASSFTNGTRSTLESLASSRASYSSPRIRLARSCKGPRKGSASRHDRRSRQRMDRVGDEGSRSDSRLVRTFGGNIFESSKWERCYGLFASVRNLCCEIPFPRENSPF